MYRMTDEVRIETSDGILYNIDVRKAQLYFTTIFDFTKNYPKDVMPLNFMTSENLDEICDLIHGCYKYNNIDGLKLLISRCQYLGATNKIFTKIIKIICDLFGVATKNQFLHFTINLYRATKLKDKIEIFKQLIILVEKEELNSYNDYGVTPLIAACTNNIFEIIPLITKKADIHKPELRGNTALMVAIKNQQEDIVNHLISVGSELNVRNSADQTPILIAFSGDNINIINSLVKKGADVNLKYTSKCITILHKMVMHNDINKIKILLAAGADLNAQDNNGYTSLMYGLDADIQIFKILIASGANLNTQDAKGNTALLLSCRNINISYFNSLIENGADINIKNYKGETVLMSSIKLKHYEITKILINLGADIHIVNNNGETVLTLLDNIMGYQRHKILLNLIR